MIAGDEITIEAGDLVAGGESLARVHGFPIFVTNVFPGDVAVVRLLAVKKGFAKADLVRIVKPSPWRRASPCPVADECGGCDWTALRLDRQLQAKQRILEESLRRIGKFDVAALPRVAVHASPLNYRIRSRLHRDGDAIGFYAMRSNRVVPLPEECEVVGCGTAKQFGLRADGTPHPVEAPSLRSGEREPSPRFAGRGDSDVWEIDDRVIAGVGFFTLPIADRFGRVFAIEGSAESARDARRNVPHNVAIVEAPVERLVARFPEADFVFLDPPRAGAQQEVVRAIGEKAREIVCYLSCDPVTFARDASRLTASGWRLSTLDLLDLFPNTHHVETLASFERARA